MSPPDPVDAPTVVAALVNSGPVGNWARDRLPDGHLVTPMLLHAETVRVLRRAELSGEVSADAAALAHSDLLDLPIETYDYLPFAERI